MARFSVAPTKSNLLRLKRESALTLEGHQLLDQKKDILTAELLALVDRARSAEEQMDKLMRAAFHFLESALLRMGKNSVAQTAAAVSTKSQVSVSRRRVMGVSLPLVEISVEEAPPSFSPGETSFWVAEVAKSFVEALKAVAMLAETKLSLTLLAREVRKTIRRVNALEKIALPDLDESVKYIRDALDEMEREAFFRMKLIKNRLMQRSAESGT